MEKRHCKQLAGGLAAALTTGLLALPTAHAATTAYQTSVLADNPYLYYRLGESSGTTAADTSGNSRPGTYTGGPTLGQPGAATVGDTAVTFDGVNDYVATSNALGFGQSMDGSSFEFVLSTTTSDRLRLFGTYNDGSTTGIDIALNENAFGNGTLANSVRLYIRDEDGMQRGATFTNASLFDGNYHHVVFTYDSTNGILGYLDGVAQTMTLGPSDLVDNFSSDFDYDPTLAARNVRGTIGAYLDGTIDEFAIYDSVLSGTQVQSHFAAIPEPSAALLGGLGLLGLLRRRRA